MKDSIVKMVMALKNQHYIKIVYSIVNMYYCKEGRHHS